MADLLVRAPALPSIHLKSILHSKPSRHEPKSTRLRHSKSTPTLRDQSGILAETLTRVNDYWLSWRDGLTAEERHDRRLREERRQILCLRMKNADTHEQWETAAEELDCLEGNDEWKQDGVTPEDCYNPDLIAERLRELDDARASCDIHAMMHLIRTALSRDLGGMDNVDLYRHSYIGTKKLIERYVESTIDTIDTVITQSGFDPTIEHRDLLEGMLFARQSFGRSALLLSGGGTFGMAHVGVMKSLFEAKLLPRIISGASAGSIVCAVTCTRTDEEMPSLMREFPYGDLAVFEEAESSDGMLDHLRRLLTEGSWSDIKHLTRVMRGLTGDLTFQEAYNRTRRILNICVSTASMYELPRLLNYVTAPNVMIWSAVAASCSVPLVFNASPLLVKDPITGEHSPWNPSPQRWIDGSVDNDLPMTRLAEMFNVNHFIVSQVNPHVVPFLAKDDYLSPDGNPERPKPSHQDDFDWVYTVTTLAKEEAMHRLQFLAEMGIWPNLATKFRSILSQKYSGDITILPEMSLHDLPRLLKNPTSDFMLRSCLAGERATWPKLSRVRDRCAIELALDRAVHQLRTRVVFSESQQDLRKHHRSIGNLQMHKQSVSISEMNGFHRQRRQSGGSLLSPAIRKSLLEGVHANENGQGSVVHLPSYDAPDPQRKPVLKRASRSHVQMSQCVRPVTAGAAEGSRASVTPPFFPSPDIFAGSWQTASNAGQPEESQRPMGWTNPWSAVRDSSELFITSTGEDVDTSEQGPSSDAEGAEPGTDESELEIYDDQSRTSPEIHATKMDNNIGPLEAAEIDISEGTVE